MRHLKFATSGASLAVASAAALIALAVACAAALATASTTLAAACVLYFKAARAAHQPCELHQRQVPLGAGTVESIASSPNYDLEAFSHNLAHGSFMLLAFRPKAMTNCANQRDRKCRHRRIKKKRRYERLATTSQYPGGNFSDTSIFKFRRTKGSLGHAFTVRIHTGNQNQTSFYSSVPHEISILVEFILRHLRDLLTDVLPQPNSLPDNAFHTIFHFCHFQLPLILHLSSHFTKSD
ncbi:hypothetical protein LOK49_LG08G00016 [Camellia lanceoleosa]|uniref:Uncharacterized protein n=1 Tax=Camellia lanceoleosa TaxID=1840588 RepID=A0ACC0GTZ2_9ERIC|nr:hypothetical protein LOK49_LG08G00016 [Camellia lanceoleosa]